MWPDAAEHRAGQAVTIQLQPVCGREPPRRTAEGDAMRKLVITVVTAAVLGAAAVGAAGSSLGALFRPAGPEQYAGEIIVRLGERRMDL